MTMKDVMAPLGACCTAPLTSADGTAWCDTQNGGISSKIFYHDIPNARHAERIFVNCL